MAKLSVKSISTMSVEEVTNMLVVYFDEDIPMMGAETKLYDWSLAQRQLLYYSACYSRICGFTAIMRAVLRGLDKKSSEYVAQATKRDMLEEAKDAMEKKYDSLSRVYTIHSGEKERSGGR